MPAGALWRAVLAAAQVVRAEWSMTLFIQPLPGPIPGEPSPDPAPSHLPSGPVPHDPVPTPTDPTEPET